MADALSLFSAFRSRWVNPDGTLTQSAQIFLREVWFRIGGANGDDGNSTLVAAIQAAQAAADQALIRSTSKPGSPSQAVRGSDLITVSQDAGGYTAALDAGQLLVAAQVFARPVAQPHFHNDAQAVLAARIFS